MFQKSLRNVSLAVVVLGVALMFPPPTAHAQRGGGGGGGSVDTIRVNKCYYAVVSGAYVELLINANSSNTSARLFAYLPNGQLLGEVQNGGGGRYGGTVFLAFTVPATITIVSSGGGVVTVPCTPFQP